MRKRWPALLSCILFAFVRLLFQSNNSLTVEIGPTTSVELPNTEIAAASVTN